MAYAESNRGQVTFWALVLCLVLGLIVFMIS